MNILHRTALFIFSRHNLNYPGVNHVIDSAPLAEGLEQTQQELEEEHTLIGNIDSKVNEQDSQKQPPNGEAVHANVWIVK